MLSALKAISDCNPITSGYIFHDIFAPNLIPAVCQTHHTHTHMHTHSKCNSVPRCPPSQWVYGTVNS